MFLNPNNYRSIYFSIDGPLNLSRSIQGSHVLFTAGASPTFVDITTTYTDGAFIGGATLEEVLHASNIL